MSDASTPEESRPDQTPSIPADPKEWGIDITESDGPDLQAGDDLDTGAAGGQRER